MFKALLPLLPGLGDALVASPMIRSLAERGARVDVLTMLDSVQEYASALDSVATVHHAPLLNGQFSTASDVLRLRRERYDLTLLPAPAARWQYHLLAASVGAKRTITHDYGGSAAAIGRLAGFELIPLRGGHRSAENERLLAPLDITSMQPDYLVPPAWKSGSVVANRMGMSTGTMRYKGNENKRWPIERFVEVASDSVGKNREVYVFVGPDERDDLALLRSALRSPNVTFVQASLTECARALSTCAVFVGNDNGIAHLSAGLGVKSLVLFGMTDPRRVQPLGPTTALRPSPCPPCSDEGLRVFSCVRNIGYRCLLEDMTVANVIAHVDRLFAAAQPAVARRVEAGPFQLYGKIWPASEDRANAARAGAALPKV